MSRRQAESWAVVAFFAVAALVVVHLVWGPWASFGIVAAVAVLAVVLVLVVHPAPVWWAWTAARWSSACRSCDLGRLTGDGKTFRAARAWWTATDHGVRVRVRVPAGMTAAEVIDRAPVIAAALRGVRSWGVWVDEARVELHVLMRDALAAPRSASTTTRHGLARWARDEAGADLWWSPAAGHTAIQGATGSGKSSTLYSLLAPLAGHRDVIVCGSDVSGLVLGPWQTGADDLIATGGGDLEDHARALEAVVQVMTERMADLVTSGLDLLTCDSRTPWLVVVLEEAPALLAAARPDRALHARLTTAIRRLKQEGRKVGVVVVTTAQRMTAAVVDSDARAQESVRITHRVDTGEALRLLHDGAHLPDVAEVRQWPPGLALVEMPGRRLTRARADWTTYADYRAAVLREMPANPLPVLAPADLPPAPDAPPAKRRPQPKRPRTASVPEVIEASG